MSYDAWKARAAVYEEPPPVCESCDGSLDEFGRCERCEARYCPDCDGDPCRCATEHLWSIAESEE